MAKGLEIDVNGKNFGEKVVKQSKKIPVLVDFYATWCGPCQALKPILEKLAKEYKGRFLLAKIDVDKNTELAEKYNVMSIPAVKLFRNGKVESEFVGMMPESKLKEWLDSKL